MSIHGTSYRTGPAPVVPCAADPEAWDLDIVGRDVFAVQAAIDTCQTCPALAACAELAAAHRPVGLIQAGAAWPEHGRSYSKPGRKAS